MMKRAGATARILMAASAAALAFAGAVHAQEDDEEEAAVEVDIASQCGATFASSGAASNTAFAAAQLLACDALLDQAASAGQLNQAGYTIIEAHANVLDRWRVSNEDLVTAAADPAPAAPPAPPVAADEEDGAEEADDAEAPAAPANDPWTNKLAERHAVETAMDGLRILARLAYQLENGYADPAALAAGLEGPNAARVNEILAERNVCASAGRAARANVAATSPSWYAFAEVDPLEPDGESVFYGREMRDDVAEAAEAYITTALATAPSLGVQQLTSFVPKMECSEREFPSEAPAT